MELYFTIDKQTYSFQADKFIDLSLEVRPNATDQPSCFHLPSAVASPFSTGTFTCSVDAGASVNCSVISSLCPHSNGTHTECVGHVLPGSVTLKDIVPLPTFLPAIVLTITPILYSTLPTKEQKYYPTGQPNDYIVNGTLLEEAFQKLVQVCTDDTSVPTPSSPLVSKEGLLGFLHHGGLILRTLPNTESKRSQQYGSTNPPYLTGTATLWAVDHGVQHLLIDLPSTDREDDQGFLIAHRTFWGLPCRLPSTSDSNNNEEITMVPSSSSSTVDNNTVSVLSHRTITEFVYVPSTVNDGYYMLNLQVSPIQLDAAPSRPILFPVQRK